MVGAGKRLQKSMEFQQQQLKGGQSLENQAKENPLSGGLTKTV